MRYDYLIVGAGFSGLVAAERLCTQSGKRCLVVEKRDHIGGNAHDCYDEHGVLIHPYGPHYFRTNSDEILKYLSQFTEWIPGDYKVQIYRDERFWSFPINLKTFEQYIGRASTSEEMESWLAEQGLDFDSITNSEQAVLSKVGKKWYEMFFEGYTKKQWARHPSELSASVCNRIPIRTDRDDRYFNDKHQVLPQDGYHTLFNHMVKACGDRLEVRLNTDYKDCINDAAIEWEQMIFTGPIDAFFDYKFGPLPYRSLRFEHEHFSAAELKQGVRSEGSDANKTPSNFPLPTFHSAQLAQPVGQVNYPGPEPFTRTVETKHITGQQINGTTVVKEFSVDYEVGKDPFYPIPAPAAQALYQRYKREAELLPNVHFIGRLGTYKYYNMDQVVGMALQSVNLLSS
ncbi:UDP-galactopyranose/dTDP-fucopyranose mutase family protein [Coraliomargarita sp. W4R53]